MMCYENRNTVMFRVLVSVAYIIIDNHICIDCLCLFQNSIFKQDREFGKTSNDLFLIGIPVILIYIMSSHGFSKIHYQQLY